jgi:hypothetical protein
MRRAAVACAVLAAGAAPAVAARPSLIVSPATVKRGGTVQIRGNADGCRAGNTLFVLSRAFPRAQEFAGVPAVLARVRRGGAFRATTTIPRRRHPGRYGVTARCGGGNLGVLAHLTVRA